jgi:hypothetical protein
MHRLSEHHQTVHRGDVPVSNVHVTPDPICGGV